MMRPTIYIRTQFLIFNYLRIPAPSCRLFAYFCSFVHFIDTGHRAVQFAMNCILSLTPSFHVIPSFLSYNIISNVPYFVHSALSTYTRLMHTFHFQVYICLGLLFTFRAKSIFALTSVLVAWKSFQCRNLYLRADLARYFLVLFCTVPVIERPCLPAA